MQNHNIDKLIYKAQTIGNIEPIEYMTPYPSTQALIEGQNIKYGKHIVYDDYNISNYDFYLGTSIDNLSKLGDKISQTSYNQELNVNTNYFWQVITYDLQGNNSASGINQFQTEP